MEKEGLVRSVKLLKKKKVKIETLVTDRHSEVGEREYAYHRPSL